MLPLLALPLTLLSFHASISPVPAPLQAELRVHEWHPGCPVALSGLRVLTVTYVGFDHRDHTGQMVVNARVAPPLERVFGTLYSMRFPIRDMQLVDEYGPNAGGDVTASFECRQAVTSPCTGSASTGTGSWSEHAYGEAIDLNPVENPYVGCARTRDPASKPFLDRSRVRPGMVTAAVVGAFRAIGWGWGGSWSGSTKDYMHFSANGH
jgi:hypothetical protein